MPRIRHCVECPNCRTRYLIAFNPYSNGAHISPMADGTREEYILHCCCQSGTGASRWKWREVRACEVSKAAYDRGYGTVDEIFMIEPAPRQAWAFEVSGSEIGGRWK